MVFNVCNFMALWEIKIDEEDGSIGGDITGTTGKLALAYLAENVGTSTFGSLICATLYWWLKVEDVFNLLRKMSQIIPLIRSALYG